MGGGGHDEPGCDSYLTIVDPDAKCIEVDEYEHWLVTVNALCSNRNLPVRLPYGGGQPAMSVVLRTDSLKEVRCLTAPTNPIRPKLLESTRWQFAKHLTLNQFSSENGLQTLKETLKLYDFEQTPQSKVLIDAITTMTIIPVNARVVQNGRVGGFVMALILISNLVTTNCREPIYFSSVASCLTFSLNLRRSIVLLD